MEQSHRYPPILFEEALKDTHKIVYSKFGPNNLGWPVARLRFRAAAIRLDKLAWVGPMHKNDVTDDFLRIFHQQVTTKASIFAKIDSEDNIEK
eukprot:6105822-Pyramimonas_sp.AAC.1